MHIGVEGLALDRGHDVPGGDNSVSSGRSHSLESKVLALVWARILWRVPYLEGIQGVLDGIRKQVRRGPVDPQDP